MLVPLYQWATCGIEGSNPLQTEYKKAYYKSLRGGGYARFCARAERESKRKFKNDVMDTPGLEHATSRCAQRARYSASPIGLRIVRIYTDLTTKLLKKSDDVAFRQVSFVNPSPTDEKLRPLSQAGNDKRDGGGECSFFKWHLFIGCESSPSSNINLDLVAQNRREMTFCRSLSPEESCLRHRKGYYVPAQGGIDIQFLALVCYFYNFINL